MSKPLKITLIILVSILLIGVLGLFVSNAVVKSKIENYLQTSLPETLDIQYGDIDVSLWNGKVVIHSPKINNTGESTGQDNLKLEMDSLMVDGFDCWDYVMNGTINIESIQIRQPKMIYFHNILVDKKDYKYSKLEKLKKKISVKRLNIQNGDLTVRNLENDSILLKTEHFTANVMEVYLDGKTVKQRIPFNFKDYNIHFNNLLYQLGDFENLEINSAKITNQQSIFKNLKLHTKYSKHELTKMISVERDHFNIEIDSLSLMRQDFGYKNDSLFYFSSNKVEIYQPSMSIYRNKLIADDKTIKPLYSKMLRELNFNLTLSELLIKNGAINYTEKVKIENSPGEINFSNLNATISNLSNTYKSTDKTTINIDAIFMKKTPLDVEWYFDVNDVNDHFVFKADLGKLNANQMNTFTEPNLNVRLEGEIYKTYFTIDGYDNSSTVDLKLNYDDFKVVIMQKKEKKKNQFLSAVANIFIKKNSDNDGSHFRDGRAEVERNKTKSVFNFIWLNASQALMNAMTGGDNDKK